MRHIALFAIALMSTAAESSPREKLSPEGQAIFEAYYSKKLVDGRASKGTWDNASDLHKRISELLTTPNPDLKTIRQLIAKEQRLRLKAQQEAIKEIGALIEQLPPADQVVRLRSMYPKTLPPIVISVSKGPPPDRPK